MPEAIKAVLFDMDGTLVDSESTHLRALLDLLHEQDLTLPAGFDEACTGMTINAVHERVVDQCGLAMALDDFIERKNAAFIGRLGELRRRHGATAALDLLDARGIRWAVVSNSERPVMDASLASLGLVAPGRVTVSRNEVAQGKPAPDPYLRAAQLLGLKPEDCLVIEDSGPGAAAGLAAGMRTIGWPEPHREDIVFPPGVHVLAATEQGGELSQALDALT
ncbi:HAD family phosphatase [Pelomonas sp. KK5]|uniref:HAD family hydrolase n=1 Tax=Pelomonas sp. KK5 TaxID=1855730 RepID=UPI00097C9090|nr:HAD family phosphatase [Pelomonas sp. KK5]